MSVALEHLEDGDEAAAREWLVEAKREAERQWDDAYWLLDFYAWAASALVKAGAGGAAADLAGEALELVNDKNGRDRTLGAAARVQAGAGQVRAAIGTAQSIIDAEHRRYVFGEMSRALLESGDLEGGSWVAEQIEDPGYRTYVLERAFATLAGRGDIATGLRMVREASDSRTRDALLGEAVDALTEAGEVQAALEFALQIEDSADQASALSWVAESQAEAGSFQEAWRTVEWIKSLEVPARYGSITCGAEPYCAAVATVAGITARAGDFAAAFAAHELVERPRDRIHVLAEVAVAKEAPGSAVFRAAVLELADSVTVDDTAGLQDIAVAQAAAGDYAGMDVTIQKIAGNTWVDRGSGDLTDDPALNPRRTDASLWRIARVHAAAGSFEEALRSVNRVGSAFGRVYLLAEVAGAQAQAGEPEAARTTLAAAVGLYERLSGAEITRCCAGTHPLIFALEAIGHAQAKAGLLDLALETVGRLEIPEGETSWAVLKIVHAAVVRGDFVFALRAQSVMDNDAIEALIYIARGLAGLPPGELPFRID